MQRGTPPLRRRGAGPRAPPRMSQFSVISLMNRFSSQIDQSVSSQNRDHICTIIASTSSTRTGGTVQNMYSCMMISSTQHIPYMYVEVRLVLVRVQVPYSCINCRLYVYCYCTSWGSGADRCIPQTLSCIQKHTTVVQNCNTDRTYIYIHFAAKPCQNARNTGKSVIMPKALPA